jgi:hypothetical protein
MKKILKLLTECKKEKMEPKVALATLAIVFHGCLSSDEEIFDYCEQWPEQNGDVTYRNLTKFVKNLGYVGEIVEIWMESQAEIP